MMAVAEKFEKRAPFVKVDAAKREVWAIVTAEIEDKDGETCDYESTKPYYQALADEMGKATNGLNICPLREMHELKAAGRGISMEFRDPDKEIFMGFKVVDNEAWNKVEERVYTGVSQGGSYVNKWRKDGRLYYTSNPSEVSLVDNPCLGIAHFAYVKADGTVEIRKINAPPPPPRDTVSLIHEVLSNHGYKHISNGSHTVKGVTTPTNRYEHSCGARVVAGYETWNHDDGQGIVVSGTGADTLSQHLALCNVAKITGATILKISDLEARLGLKKYSYGTTQIEIAKDSDIAKTIEEMRASIDDADVGGPHGKNIENHITVRYGLVDGDTTAVKEFLQWRKPFEVSFGETDNFPPTDHSDQMVPLIVKIDSNDLHEVNAGVGTYGNWRPPDFGYNPHLTIAYVKPGTESKYKGQAHLVGKKYKVDEILIRPKDGEPTKVQLLGKAAKSFNELLLQHNPKLLENLLNFDVFVDRLDKVWTEAAWEASAAARAASERTREANTSRQKSFPNESVRRAKSASEWADNSSKGVERGITSHQQAATAHQEAAKENRSAAKRLKESGYEESSKKHSEQAKYHRDRAKEHLAASDQKGKSMGDTLLKTMEELESRLDIDKGVSNKAVKYLVTEDNGTTHLPYTGEDGKPDHNLMGAAWAALHGGYRGNKYSGPDKQAAIDRLKGVYRSEGKDTPGEKAVKLAKMVKSMWQVGQLANVLDQIQSMRAQSIFESFYEGDPEDMDIAELFGNWLDDGCEIIQRLISHEVEEYDEQPHQAGASPSPR